MKNKGKLETLFLISIAVLILFLLLCLVAVVVTAVSKVVSESIITMLAIISVGIIAKAYLYERTK